MLMKFIRFKVPYSQCIKKWGMLGMKKFISSVSKVVGRVGRARAGFEVFRDFDVARFGQKGYNL